MEMENIPKAQMLRVLIKIVSKMHKQKFVSLKLDLSKQEFQHKSIRLLNNPASKEYKYRNTWVFTTGNSKLNLLSQFFSTLHSG